MKKVLITGGGGFGGSGLTKALLKKGFKVTVLSRTAPNHCDSLREEIDRGKIKYIWEAVQDIEKEDIKGQDIICHFAAQADVPMGFYSPIWTAWQNIIGTIKVLEAVKGEPLEKFLLPSSGNVFGRPLYLPIDEKHPLTAHNPYSASKAAQEIYSMAYYRSYGIPVVIFRNGIVYGPGMRREIFIYKWLKNLLLKKPIIVEGGDQTRDPCYVSETIDAWVKAVEAEPKKVTGEAFQVSRGKEYKVEDIAKKCIDLVFKETGFRGKIIKKDYRPGEKGQRECFDITKARKILGYEPKIDLEEGLKKTLDWMRRSP